MIKNFQKLSKNSQSRKDILKIVEEGLYSISPSFVLKNKIKLINNKLTIGKDIYNLDDFKNIYVCGFGKASSKMAEKIEQILGKRIKNGLVIDTSFRKTKIIKVKKGTHPLLSRKNIQSSNQIINIAKQATNKDLIILLISGGGSALFEKPCNSYISTLKINQKLLLSGASIHEVNIIRKHISQVKGGNFANLTKTKIVSLIFSDVIGDDLDIIASGPTVLDKSTVSDAQKIIKKYKLPKVKLYETPKDKKIFNKTENIIILNNKIPLEAMSRLAKKLNYKPKIITNKLTGESKKVSDNLLMLAKKMKGNEIYLFGGETTVLVKGNGKGGRNCQLSLNLLKKLPQNIIFISIGSDGIDNTDAAGAIIDKKTLEKSEKLKLDIDEYLKNNDSYNFFKKTNNLIFTGPTDSNVADLILMLKH